MTELLSERRELTEAISAAEARGAGRVDALTLEVRSLRRQVREVAENLSAARQDEGKWATTLRMEQARCEVRTMR